MKVAIAAIAALALVAAACGEAEPEFEAGPLGAVTIAPDEPVKIAALQAISGAVASLGEDQVRGIEIAIDDYGELLGHSIELSVEDDLCSSEGGTTGAQRIVSDPQIIGVIGTSCSGAGVPAAQIISEANRVMISGSNTSPSLTAVGYLTPGDPERAENSQTGYYRTAHNDEFQGQGAAQFLYDQLGLRSIATIHDGDPYTQGLTTQAGFWFGQFGGLVALPTAINKGDTDMRQVLTDIASTNAEAIFFPIFQPEADFIVQQVKEIPGLENVILMGADGLLSDTFVTLPDTQGMYLSGPARAESAAYDTFVTKYEAKYGETPIQAFHAHAYDATNMLLGTIEAVAEQADDGTLFVDMQKLRDALYATTNFNGLTGSLSCNEFGDCAAPAVSVYQNVDPNAGIFGTVGNVVFKSEAVKQEG